MNLKSATQCHFSLFAFCEDRPDPEHSTHLGADDHAANGRGDHKFYVCIFEVLGDFAAEQMKVFGILKYPSTLEILRAMEPGSEAKVPFQKGFRLAEDVKNLFFGEFHEIEEG